MWIIAPVLQYPLCWLVLKVGFLPVKGAVVGVMGKREMHPMREVGSCSHSYCCVSLQEHSMHGFQATRIDKGCCVVVEANNIVPVFLVVGKERLSGKLDAAWSLLPRL